MYKYLDPHARLNHSSRIVDFMIFASFQHGFFYRNIKINWAA